MKKPPLLIATACLFLPLISACASSQPPSYDAISGTYTLSLTEQQLLDVGSGPVLAIVGRGDWQLELTADGNSRLSQVTEALGPSLREQGPYTLSGDEITFEQQAGEFSCPVPGATGTYKWLIDGGRLTFTAIQDPCDRKYLFIAQPWSPKP